MDGEYRQRFNRGFTDTLYRAYQQDLTERVGTPFDFRLAETPVFLPQDLRRQLVDSANEIVRQISQPSLLERMKEAIPEEWDTPGLRGLPSFAQVDFAIVRAAD